MIQTEIIYTNNENSFIEDLNYFLEKLQYHQLIDIKFNSFLNLDNMIFQALIIYKTE